MFQGFSTDHFYRLPQGWTDFFTNKIREMRESGTGAREAVLLAVSTLHAVEYVARWTWGTRWERPEAFAALSLDEFLHGRRVGEERADGGCGIRSREALLAALGRAVAWGLLEKETAAGRTARWRLRPAAEEPLPEGPGFPVFRPHYFAVPLVWNDMRPRLPPAMVLIVELLMEETFAFRAPRRAWRRPADLATVVGLDPSRVRGLIARGLREGLLVRREDPAGGFAVALRLRGDDVDPDGTLRHPSPAAMAEERAAAEALLRAAGIARYADLAAELVAAGWTADDIATFLDREGNVPPALLVYRLRQAAPPDPRASEDILRRRIAQSWGRLGRRPGGGTSA